MDPLALALERNAAALAKARAERAAKPSRRAACAPSRTVRKNTVGVTWPAEKHETVQSLAAQNEPYSVIARIVGAHPDTISDYCRAYDCIPLRYWPQARREAAE